MAKAAQAWARSQHHGRRVVEQELERLVDYTHADEARIDDAVEAQNDLPGEDAQQIAGPERHRDEDQPDQLVARHLEGDEIGHGIGQDERCKGAEQRHPDGLHLQSGIDRLFEKGGVISQCESLVEIQVILRPEAVIGQVEQRQAHQADHDQQRRQHQRITAQPFVLQKQCPGGEDRAGPLLPGGEAAGDGLTAIRHLVSPRGRRRQRRADSPPAGKLFHATPAHARGLPPGGPAPSIPPACPLPSAAAPC